MLKERLLALLPALLCIAAWMPAGIAQTSEETLAGRDAFVHLPAGTAGDERQALVVVLHGGLGNGELIAHQRAREAGMNLDLQSDARGFIVAYLDGTPASTRLAGSHMLTWNAGGQCCGASATNDVDDVAYIERAVAELEAQHAIDPERVFVVGHSNGAMMAQRLMCESKVFRAAVAIAGPLNLSAPHCAAARGKDILAIHGDADLNVPLAGGVGSGLSGVSFVSEAQTAAIYRQAGLNYQLQVLPGVGHALPDIDAELKRSEGHTLAAKIADYFKL